MDFKDSIKQIAERIEKLKDNLPTEEATKNALIMPVIQALGYDIFNPLEVLPEMSCDIGTKKGEKIDYAILKDGEPIILIECKHWAQELNLHDNQLLRYFHVSKAKFGVLTNGIVYRFYTDLSELNKMDEKPFLEVNMLDLKDTQIEELKKFHKSYFDTEKILSSASELKYLGELKVRLSTEFTNPSTEFVKFISKGIYTGMFTQKVIEQFTSLVKRSVSSYINDIISERLKAAIESGNEKEQQEAKEIAETENAQIEQAKTIETTDIELNGYYIVKSILRAVMPVERIVYKDNKDYFAINIDNVWNNVCRLYFNNPDNLRIVLRTDDKRINISSLDDIYKYSEQLIDMAKKFI
jgi:hypothetical protein